MVVFNPGISDTQDPNWTNVSKPISDIQADKSKAIAISGAADVLDSSVKVADTLTKEAIKTDTDTGVDKLRDAQTQALQATRNIQIGQQTGTLLPKTDQPAPPASLQNGLDRVQQIGTALAQNGGKINDTLYTGALNSLAKQLRAQYPGYRDYVDEQIKSVSGVDPANAFMKNLMEDINRNADKNKTEINQRHEMLNELIKQGYHDGSGVDASMVKKAFDAGVISGDGVDKWVNTTKKVDYDFKQKAAARADRQLGDEDTAKTTFKDLTSHNGQVIDQNWQTMTIGKGTDTPAGLSKFLYDNAGNQNKKDENSQAIGEQMVQMRRQTFNTLWVDANKGGDNSMMAKSGGDPEKVKANINASLATFDLAIQDVFKGEWGSAYSHMNTNKAINSDSTNLLYNASDEETRKYNRMVGAINTISPQASGEFFQRIVTGTVPEGEKALLKNMKMELITQPDASQGKLTSVQEGINEMKKKGATSPKTYSDFIDTVNTIADPKWGLEHRLNVARSFFDPVKNAGLLSDENFKKDYTDKNGRQIPGKYSVFSRMSSPEVAAGIAELSKTDPSIGRQYRTMMSSEFGEQLFNREIKDLGQENQQATPSGAYKIKYTDDGKNVPYFQVTDMQGIPLTNQEAILTMAPTGALNRLNGGIAGMYNVYKATGSGDAGHDILENMAQHGYTDVQGQKGWTGNAGDIPRMIWQSIISSQQDYKREMKKLAE